MEPEAQSRRIYEEFFPQIYNYAYLRVREAAAADDVAAEVFRKVFEHLEDYSGEKASLRTWIFAIARNAVNDYFRRRQWRRWLTLEALRNIPGPEQDADERLLQEEALVRLRRAMGRLGERERDLLALKFTSRMNNREIARATGISESNVGTIVYRALKRLKEELGSRGGG